MQSTTDLDRPSALAPRRKESGWAPRTWPLLVYATFALVVYVLHGHEPTLSIDHISYFRLADEIRKEFPGGDYYRTINSVRLYSVVLAYLFDYTGSHVASLKLVLAVVTVASLAAFQVFMGLVTDRLGERVLFAVLSGLFVSFGASVWGMTDFAASLNRTLVIPFVILLVWFFFRSFGSPWRFAIFPALTLLSAIHLSALHVVLVFLAFEALDFAVRRRFRPTRDLAHLAVAGVASIGVQLALEVSGTGTANFVQYTLRVAVPKVPSVPPAETVASRGGAPVEMTPGAGAPMPDIARDPREKRAEARPKRPPSTAPSGPARKPGSPVPPVPSEPVEPEAPPTVFDIPVAPDLLSIKGAWDIELFAFPWRNMPPSLATIATIASSFGVILLLAVMGAVLARRRRDHAPFDRPMLLFAGGVMLAAYGLQTFLWATRGWLPIFPVNFEEIRAVNMLMFPAIYFVFRLYRLAPPVGPLAAVHVRALVVAAFVLQPILLVRALPASWREGILEAAIERGAIKRTDFPRVFYARHFLGLATEGRRFYYSSLGAIRWLDRNVAPDEVVLTNVDDFIVLKCKTTGTFLNVVSMQVSDRQRGHWVQALDTVDKVMATRDTATVRQFAKKMGANYAVVTWPVAGAVYRDQYYSILRID